jgi:hydrogenase expression/formation protein HypC
VPGDSRKGDRARGGDAATGARRGGGVRRQVNVDLLADEALGPGDWVLIHVGFAMSKISPDAAEEQVRMLAMLGEDLQAMEEIEGYQFGREPS